MDLDGPLADLSLRPERLGIAYRSLLAVARLDGQPLGAVAVPVSARGRVSGDWLAELLRCELESELHAAFARRGLHMPASLPRDGIPGRSPDRRSSAARRRSISVVVTASHDPALLERCLRSIFACDHPDFEVVVVEQRHRSSDTTRMLRERFQDQPRLRWVFEVGGGASRARNAGLACASGDVVMFTDDDVIVDPGWISRCAEAFDHNDAVACVTGLILPRELETESHLLCERFASVARGFRGKEFRLPQGQVTHPFFYYTPGAMGSGANTALRADVARELDGFDAALGSGTPALGGEDLDVYVRVLQAGHRVRYDPSVIVWREQPDGPPRPLHQNLRRGVSVGAALTKQLIAAPERFALLRAVPAGVRYELDPSAPADRREKVKQQRALDWLWRLGVALGPTAYAASALRLAPTRSSRRAASLAPQTTATRADRALVAVAAALCIVAPALVATGAPGNLRLPAVLALLCLAPGTALVIALGRQSPSAEPGLVVGASLGVAAVLAQTMLWLGAWWPKVFLYLLAVACLLALRAWYRRPASRPRARRVGDGDRAVDDAPRDALGTWATEVELAAPVSDRHPPRGPNGARNGRAAHPARDGLQPAAPTPDGFPPVESPPCAAAGSYREPEPFVSVILSESDQNGAGPLGPSLQAALGVDYPAFEVVVARAASKDTEARSRELKHPQLHYVYEPSPDAWAARRRAVDAAGGDVLVFIDSDVVVDPNWVRALAQGLTPAARVACVTGSVVAPRGSAAGTGVNFAVSRDALLAVGGVDGIRTSAPTGGSENDALISRFLLAGWAVSHKPDAQARRLPAHDREGVGVLASIANPLERSTAVRELRQWLRRQREGVRARSLTGPATLHAAVLVAAGVAWGLSLRGADLSRMAGLGLLDAMPAPYFIGVGLLLLGFMASLTRQELPNRLLWLYAFALILVLHGTTALLYDEPRYPWVYKHLGVIALIAHSGAVDRSVDIYNNWPGFFALIAWLSSVTGVSAISYAAWAQVFFNVVNVLAVRFALRGLTRDERLLWTASLFFLLGNWVGQDYLSPQAFGFVLTLVVLGLCLRCGPASTRPHSCRAPWLTSRLEQLGVMSARTPDDDLPPPPLGPRVALIIGGLCYLAVVTSHQLSPVMLILSVAAISLVARRVPVWIPVAMLAIEVWWVGLAWPFVKDHFSLIDPGPAGAAAVGRDLHSALPGAVLGFYAPAAVVALIAILALCGAARRLRAGKRDLVPVCLILAPLLGSGLQSYGGEGGNRAYLFALPWLAFFAAAACVRPPLRSDVVRMRFGSVAVATAAVSVCLLFAYFGQELANRIAPDDVRAAAWYEQHAPPGSIRIVVAPNTPDRLTARYPLVSLNTRPALVQLPAFRGHLLGAADVPRLERVIAPLRPNPTFLLLSQGQENYARLNGLLPSGSISRLARALDATAAFRLVYRRPTAWIFEYAPRSPH